VVRANCKDFCKIPERPPDAEQLGSGFLDSGLIREICPVPLFPLSQTAGDLSFLSEKGSSPPADLFFVPGGDRFPGAAIENVTGADF
jgi:hypothetical protein